MAFGAEVNDITNVFDQTALSLAVIDHPNLDIAKFLLRKGAKILGSNDWPMILGRILIYHIKRSFENVYSRLRKHDMFHNTIASLNVR